jgi:hypothetical protein
MRRWNIETGREVQLNSEVWQCIVRRGDAHKYAKNITVHEGTGPANKILLMLNDNGIGDDVHALPAIAQKIREGFDITVIARKFTRSMFEKLGCKFIEACPEGMPGFLKENLPRYGLLYNLPTWCIDHDEETSGNVFLTRFEQFAKKIGTTLPESFDFRAYVC